MVNLSNGIYELTPVGETIVDEGPLNLTELNQDLDQRPQEPKASLVPKKASPGAYSHYFRAYLRLHILYQL